MCCSVSVRTGDGKCRIGRTAIFWVYRRIILLLYLAQAIVLFLGVKVESGHTFVRVSYESHRILRV